jgi:hypothetical protein
MSKLAKSIIAAMGSTHVRCIGVERDGSISKETLDFFRAFVVDLIKDLPDEVCGHYEICGFEQALAEIRERAEIVS